MSERLQANNLGGIERHSIYDLPSVDIEIPGGSEDYAIENDCAINYDFASKANERLSLDYFFVVSRLEEVGFDEQETFEDEGNVTVSHVTREIGESVLYCRKEERNDIYGQEMSVSYLLARVNPGHKKIIGIVDNELDTHHGFGDLPEAVEIQSEIIEFVNDIAKANQTLA